WPAVDEQQRNRARLLRLDVDEMDALAVDLGAEVGQLVELGLLLSPVERRGPLGQLLHLCQLRSAIALTLDGRRPGRSSEALAQIVQFRLGDSDGELLDDRHCGPPCLASAGFWIA